MRPNVKNIKRYFRQTEQGSAPGTFWKWGKVWVSAHHVHKAQFSMRPPFIDVDATSAGKLIDAVIYGDQLPTARPREPKEKERVIVFGFPGGSADISYRLGEVYFKRKESGSPGYETATWIAKFDEQPDSPTPFLGYMDIGAMYEPVVVGMSGGLVQSTFGEPLGVLVVRNGIMDSDNDDRPEQGCDFVALSDIWDVFSGAGEFA